MLEGVDASTILGLYEREYFSLLATYESFNEQSLLIKGWSVTVGLAVILACYRARPGEEPGRLAVLIASLAIVPFYALDALWKAVQSGYLDRLTQIECLLRPAAATDAPACIAAAAPLQSITLWSEVMTRPEVFDRFVLALVNPTVALPHVLILVGGLLLAIFYPPNRRKTLPFNRSRNR